MSDDEIDLDDLRLDLSDAEEQSFQPLPAGTYNATLVEAKVTKSKAGDPMVNWTWELDGYNGRKVWGSNMLSFNDKRMTKGKPPQTYGKMFKNNFFTLLLALTDDNGELIFDKSTLNSSDVVIGDIIEQAVGSKANLRLKVDVEYDNNKIVKVRKYDPSNVDDGDSDEMPV